MTGLPHCPGDCSSTSETEWVWAQKREFTRLVGLLLGIDWLSLPSTAQTCSCRFATFLCPHLHTHTYIQYPWLSWIKKKKSSFSPLPTNSHVWSLPFSRSWEPESLALPSFLLPTHCWSFSAVSPGSISPPSSQTPLLSFALFYLLFTFQHQAATSVSADHNAPEQSLAFWWSKT